MNAATRRNKLDDVAYELCKLLATLPEGSVQFIKVKTALFAVFAARQVLCAVAVVIVALCCSQTANADDAVTKVNTPPVHKTVSQSPSTVKTTPQTELLRQRQLAQWCPTYADLTARAADAQRQINEERANPSGVVDLEVLHDQGDLLASARKQLKLLNAIVKLPVLAHVCEQQQQVQQQQQQVQQQQVQQVDDPEIAKQQRFQQLDAYFAKVDAQKLDAGQSSSSDRRRSVLTAPTSPPASSGTIAEFRARMAECNAMPQGQQQNRCIMDVNNSAWH